MRADPVALWPSLRRLTVHARDAGSSDFTISSIDLDIAIAAPTWGEA
jgi:hypothetical protein